MPASLRRSDYRRPGKGRSVLLIALLVVAAAFLGMFAGGLFDAPPAPTGAVTPTATATPTLDPALPTPTPEPTSTPTPEPTPTTAVYPTPDFSKNLSDPADFFGPLPVVADPKTFEHFPVRALYVSGGSKMADNLALVQKSEQLNAVVVDLKESNGVYFQTTNELARQIGAVKGGVDLPGFVASCHAKGVRVIGRFVIFKDPILAKARPDLCLQDKSGNTLLFNNEGGLAFVSPYRQEVWDYNIALAREAVAIGVDEIQFDYVRFPTGTTKSGATIYVGPDGMYPTRVQTINRFLAKAKIEISDRLGAPLGADVFGIILSSKTDGKNLGQDWASIGVLPGVDNLCPMIYPSHYATSASNGKGTFLNGTLYPKPDLEPYGVMYNALLLGKEATKQTGFAAVRPYLQAFTASYLPDGFYQTYGATQIREQIKAINDAGFTEWICWNSTAVYPSAAFD
jgi:hypothetical protein